MKVKINCPKCKGVLIVPGDAAGRKARCAFCKNKFIIPSFDKKIDDMATQWLSMDAFESEDDFLSEGPAQLQYDKMDEPKPAAPSPAATGTPEVSLSSGMADDDMDNLDLEDIERELERSDQTGTIGKGAASSGVVSPVPKPQAPKPAPVPPAAKPKAPAPASAPKKPAPPPKPAARPAAAAHSGSGEMRLQDLVADPPPPSRPAPAKAARSSGNVELKIEKTGQVKVVGKPAPKLPAPPEDDVIEFSDEDTAIELIQIETPGVVDPAARSTVNLVPASGSKSDLEQMLEGTGADLEIEVDTNDSSSLGFDPVQVVSDAAPAKSAPPGPAATVDPSRIPWGKPRLAIVDQNSSRVVFGFDPELLKSEGFRTSMPMMCLGCRKDTPADLLARPILWVDRTVRKKVDEDEAQVARDLLTQVAKFQAEVSRNKTATTVREVLRLLNEIPGAKEPFGLPMPYFVCRECAAENVLYATIMPSDKGPWCQVQVTTPPVALAWLGRVHGVTGDEYADLEKRVLFMTEVWRTIPEKVRRNMSGWFDFEPGEEFIGYLPDADFQQKEIGLAGIVITDRRLSWHKYGKRGDLPVGTPASLKLRRDGSFIEVSQETGGKLQKMVRLRPDDASSLKLMLEEVESAIQAVEA